MSGGWIFGYGSLMWKPGFRFTESARAAIRGYARRFWQGSTDHRGVPEAPGRVVTLVEESGASCAGLAFRVSREEMEAVLAALDHREKGGYARIQLPLEFLDGRPAEEGIVYYAASGNPNYLGPAPLTAVAAQVAMAHGPSGSNREYVLRLAETLRLHDLVDEHVFAVESLLLEALEKERA